MSVLRVSHLTKRFGGLVAVDDVSLEVAKGEILGLIGPNGAGKTTFVNLLTGSLESSSGEIFYDGQNITRLASHQRCRLGLSRTFQVPQPFVGMTVLENVMAAALFGSNPSYRSMERARERALEVLALVELVDSTKEPVSALTTAGLKRLELARCLAGDPLLMFLDEPLGGLNQSELKDALAMIRRIREGGTTIVFIEHIVPAVMTLCDRIVVLANGAKLAEGTPQQVQQNKEVQLAYLGDVTGAVERYAKLRGSA